MKQTLTLNRQEEVLLVPAKPVCSLTGDLACILLQKRGNHEAGGQAARGQVVRQERKPGMK